MTAMRGATPARRRALAARAAGRLLQVPARLGKLAYRSGLRSSANLTFPDFLGIGLMKSGTTWLYENLRAHPGVRMSEEKELRYFSSDRFWSSLASYAERFADADGRVTGEISPPYASLPPNRIAFVRQIMPHVRLLLMLRDPVTRQWSHVTHKIRENGDDAADVSHDDILSLIDRTGRAPRGGYTGVLDSWLAHFPQEQLFVGLYEQIAADPRGLLGEVFRHLRVSTDVEWSAFPTGKVIVPPVGPKYADRNQGRGVIGEVHSPSTAYFPERYRDLLTERYEGQLRELHRRLGDRILLWDSARRVLGAPDQGTS